MVDVNTYITILRIHNFFSTALWLILPILGLWGIFLAIRKQELNVVYSRALFICGQLVVIVQGVVGIILWISEGWPAQGWLHILLGAIAALFLVGVSIYVRDDTSNRAQWIYAAGAFLLFVIALLASSTG